MCTPGVVLTGVQCLCVSSAFITVSLLVCDCLVHAQPSAFLATSFRMLLLLLLMMGMAQVMMVMLLRVRMIMMTMLMMTTTRVTIMTIAIIIDGQHHPNKVRGEN